MFHRKKEIPTKILFKLSATGIRNQQTKKTSSLALAVTGWL